MRKYKPMQQVGRPSSKRLRMARRFGVASLVLAIVPAILVFGFKRELAVELVLVLNFLAWSLVCIAYRSEQALLESFERASAHFGMANQTGSLAGRIRRLVRTIERFELTSPDYNAEPTKDPPSLGSQLLQIVELAYFELEASSVELALFDEKTGLWTQAFLIGSPTQSSSQSMLAEAARGSGQLVEGQGQSDLVHSESLVFSGTLFGRLRLELAPGASLSSDDAKFLKLLSVRGSLMLINARFTDELLRMRRSSEESVQAKTGFLANLSHEIRGPLGIILNGVELVIDGLCGPVTDSQRETLGMLKQNGDHLLDLVNDVLDYAKVEAGKIKAKPASLKLAPLLGDLANVVRTQSLQKKQKLTVEVRDKELTVVCDKRHIRQMMINLLTNAVKYTPEEGSITVAAERVSGNRVKISVEDTGIGIPLSEQSKVFGAFERVDDAYALAQKGTGLGMPLTKRLVEVNEGQIGFESEPGEGSNFWIVLPAGEDAAQSDAAAEEARSERGEARGRGEGIAIIAANSNEREMFERYLDSRGFRPFVADDGREFLRLIREEEISLALIENDLPQASGEELVSAIRSNPKSTELPVILMSAKAFVFDIEAFLKLGVDRCLTKPFELRELGHTARELLDEVATRSSS